MASAYQLDLDLGLPPTPPGSTDTPGSGRHAGDALMGYLEMMTGRNTPRAAAARAATPAWLRGAGRLTGRGALPLTVLGSVGGQLLNQDPTEDGVTRAVGAGGAALGSIGTGLAVTAAATPLLGPMAPIAGALAAGFGGDVAANLAKGLIPGAADRAAEKALQQQIRAEKEKAAAQIAIDKMKAETMLPLQAKAAEAAMLLEIQRRGLLAPLEERAARMQAFNSSLANMQPMASPIAQGALI